MINEYVVLDLEMTGLSAKTDQIIEIGAVKIKDNQVVDTMDCLVNPRCKIPTRISELTGITDEMVQQGGRPFIISECDNRAVILKDGVKVEYNRPNLRGKMYRELYDLREDPDEFENRFDDPRYAGTIRELTALLEAEPDLMETVFRPYADGGDYWLNDGTGAGFAFNGAKPE